MGPHQRAHRQRPEPVAARFAGVAAHRAQRGMDVAHALAGAVPNGSRLRSRPPCAPLFNRRHTRRLQPIGTQVIHHRIDAIAQLPELLARHPGAAVWFDNVLGQLRYLERDENRLARQLQTIRNQLRHRTWGSVHDWLSGSVQSPPAIASVPSQWVHLNDQGQRVCRADGSVVKTSDEIQRLLVSVNAQGVWQDHGCLEMFPFNTRRCWIPWAFSSQHWHWLELGWVNA